MFNLHMKKSEWKRWKFEKKLEISLESFYGGSRWKSQHIHKRNMQPFAVETVLRITGVRIQEVHHHLLQLVNSWHSRLLLCEWQTKLPLILMVSHCLYLDETCTQPY